MSDDEKQDKIQGRQTLESGQKPDYIRDGYDDHRSDQVQTGLAQSASAEGMWMLSRMRLASDGSSSWAGGAERRRMLRMTCEPCLDDTGFVKQGNT